MEPLHEESFTLLQRSADRSPSSGGSPSRTPQTTIRRKTETLLLRFAALNGLPVIHESEYWSSSGPPVALEGSLLNGFPVSLSETALSTDYSAVLRSGITPAATLEEDHAQNANEEADVDGVTCVLAPPAGSASPAPGGDTAATSKGATPFFSIGIPRAAGPAPAGGLPQEASEENFCAVCFEPLVTIEDRGADHKYHAHVLKCLIHPCGHTLCLQCLLNLCQARALATCNCRWKGYCPLCRGGVYLRNILSVAGKAGPGTKTSFAYAKAIEEFPMNRRPFTCAYCEPGGGEGCARPL